MDPVLEATLRSWTCQPRIIVPLLLTAVIYARGWRILYRQMPARFPTWRLAAFLAGMGTLLVAIVSPLDAFGLLSLPVHMIQHLLLMMLAPLLVWLGAPVTPLLRGLPHAFVKDGLGPFLAWPALHRVGRVLGHPIVCWTSFVVVTWVWHLPALYELALRSPPWHEIEHLCFLGSGLLFWWPVVQPWPSTPIYPRWAMIPYLSLAIIQNGIFSALFTFADRVFYPTYVVAPRLWGLTPLDGQVVAGVIMWVPGSMMLLLPLVGVLVDLLRPPQVRPGAMLAAGTPAGRAWSAARDVTVPGPPRAWDALGVPYLGPLLRARGFRRGMQAGMLVLAAAIVVDGLLGPQMSPMNLAGVLPWTYWRGFVVIALLVAGNLFCMVCPFMLPRDLGRRILPARWSWPARWRSKWLAVGLLALYLWAYEVFSLWGSPWWTAWIAIGYFVAAFVIDGLFRGASFCKYVCPIGQFHFVHATVSPLEVAVKDPAVCARCVTHDCIRGNEQHRGCELELFQPEKVGNLDCTFCLDCVRACPHTNVGVLAVTPARDLLGDPFRSSLRRLSTRPDLAALALVLVFGAFANAAGMVGPVVAWEDRITSTLGADSTTAAVSLFIVLAIGVLPPLLTGLCAWMGRWASGAETTRRALACRFALSLVPLGLAMWTAHFMFHLLSSAGTAVPVVQRVARDLGSSLGPPDWTAASAASLGGNRVLPLELTLLGVGLLVTLFVGWRVARDCVGDGTHDASRVAMRLAIPWASLAMALYVAGVWIVAQPMQMRGMMMH